MKNSKPSGFVPRLYIEQELTAQADITLNMHQTHYVKKVMRLGSGDELVLFNGRDGEWAGTIASMTKNAQVIATRLLRSQREPIDLWLLCSPLRGGRSAWLAQKAAELGVKIFYPVLTAYSVVRSVNLERLRAHAIEGAEQSENLNLPAIQPLRQLSDVLQDWPEERQLIFCDEQLKQGSAHTQLSALGDARSFAILIGPEGGFAPEERDLVYAMPSAHPLRLGDHILRAETAALAALVLFHAVLGDWRGDKVNG